MYFKNELEELEELLESLAMNPSSRRGVTLPLVKGEWPAHFEIVAKCNEAKKNIRKFAFGVEKPKQRRTYIQRHQHALVRMWDAVFAVVQEGEVTKNTKEPQRPQRGSSTSTPTLNDLRSKPMVSSASGGQSANTVQNPISKKAATDAKDTRSTQRQLLMEVCAELEAIHDFLQTEYADCFDAHAQVADGYLSRAREGLKVLNCAPLHHYGSINGTLKIACWYAL